jgi:phosphate transport system permease protein
MSAQQPQSGPLATPANNTKGMSSATSSAKWQDFIFHKITFSFALLVLLVLVGIMVSLVINAIPAFEKFGPGFITRIEWDPVNNEYGALIAIAGTLITSLHFQSALVSPCF